MVGPLHLNCLMNGDLVGCWHKDLFGYAPAWMASPQRRPISLSMPLRERPYRGQVVRSFFENLLPDLPTLRTRLAARLGVRTASPWDILGELGRDCAGAIQLVPAHLPRSEAHLSGVPLRPDTLDKFLRIVPRTPILRCLKHHFRVALSGAQDKTALLYYQGQWRLPTHSTGTTHIFKLPSPTQSVENEWLCHLILQAYGIPTAPASLQKVNQRNVLAIERFDRRWSSDGTRLLRIPTEDLCQAMGVPCHKRYQRDGGPSLRQIMTLLLGSAQPEQDRLDFLKTQIVFWMLAAREGHAKNFSLFLEAGGRFRLAPRYDVVSSHPHPNGPMAMSIGGQFERADIHLQHWQKEARACKLQRHLPQLLQQLTQRTPQVLQSVHDQLPLDFPPEIARAVLNGLSASAHQLAQGF